MQVTSDDPAAGTARALTLWAAFYLLVRAFCCSTNVLGWLLEGEWQGPAPLRAAAVCTVLTGIVWGWVSVPVLASGLFRRKRWAWAATQATLLTGGAASFGPTVAIAAATPLNRDSPELTIVVAHVGVELVSIACIALLASGLFRERESFAVQETRGWAAIYSDGWWALGLGLVNMGGSVLLCGMQRVHP